MKNKTINRTMMTVYLLMIIACVGMFVGLYWFNDRVVVRDNINSSIYNSVSELQDRVASDVDKVVGMSTYIANDEKMHQMIEHYRVADDGEKAEIENGLLLRMNEMLGYRAEILNFNLYLKGKSVPSSRMNSIMSYTSFCDNGLEEIMEGISQTVVEKRVVSLNGNDVNVITALAMVYDSNDSVVGCVSLDIGEKYIYSVLSRNAISENSNIMLINVNGNIVAAKDKSNIGRQAQITGEIIGSQHGAVYTAAEKKKTVFVTDVNSLGWRVVEISPKNEIYPYNITDVVFMLVLCTVMIAIVGVIMMWMMKRVSRPITELVKKIRNFDIPDGENYGIYPSEISELYESYTDMHKNINMLMEKNRQEEKLRIDAEFEALRAQINPHFLYNTLDIMKWKAESEGADNVSHMTVMLSRLLRIGLNHGERWYTLCEELEYTKLYIEIQKIAYSGKFSCFIQNDTGADKFYVPKLILQPLVENSVLHGFKDIESGGKIDITWSTDSGELEIEIRDNGCGIKKEQLSLLLDKDSKHGYGLKNVNDRIKLLCGEKYGLFYSAQEKTGVCVRVILPIREKV